MGGGGVDAAADRRRGPVRAAGQLPRGVRVQAGDGSDLEDGGDGAAAAGCEVRVWDPEALRCRQTLAAPGGGEVWALLPVGAALWGGVGRRVVVWE